MTTTNSPQGLLTEALTALDEASQRAHTDGDIKRIADSRKEVQEAVTILEGGHHWALPVKTPLDKAREELGIILANTTTYSTPNVAAKRAQEYLGQVPKPDTKTAHGLLKSAKARLWVTGFASRAHSAVQNAMILLSEGVPYFTPPTPLGEAAQLIREVSGASTEKWAAKLAKALALIEAEAAK